MIEIKVINDKLFLLYEPETEDTTWIDQKLKKEKQITIGRIFSFTNEHAIDNQISIDQHSTGRMFLLGETHGEYYIIEGSILGLKYDLLLDKKMKITKKTFVATGSISIFLHIDKLINEQIVIGGGRDSAVPIQEFERLLKNFPTKTTCEHYANSLITGILKDYFNTITDAQKKLEDHLAMRDSFRPILKIDALYEYEIQKYIYIRDRLTDMLYNSDSYSEADWQKLMLEFILLIFPKYVAVLEKVRVKDYYSKPSKISDRYIDLTLVDANGNIDIIEIKKPFKNCLLSMNKYRDNHTPRKELSGSVMQVEKYLFHLNKWGAEGEKQLNKERSKDVPQGMRLHITSPKAIIVLGRENDFEDSQLFDFEIIKRKYANIMDIMTYDDLLRRLANIIKRFE